MTGSLLRARGLSVSFVQEEEQTHAVRGIDFEIGEGETVAIVGESGSGKSVTALSTVGLLPDSARVEGSVTFRGTELIDANESTLRGIRGNDISFIFQEPMTSLNPLHTLEKQIGEILSVHQHISGEEQRQKTIDLLIKTGIDNPESRLGSYPHQFSGGQRQRIMISMALANNPALLIADEPTTALDVTIQAQILELLAELKSRENMALLFITHDLGVVRNIADRVCVMQDGRIVEVGDMTEVFAHPKHSYTKLLLKSEPKGQPERFDDRSKPIVEAVALKVWFPVQRGFLRHTVGHIKAVNPSDLNVRRGETVGIVGESGSGKTTLALGLLRLVSSDGSIRFLGKELQGLRSRQLRTFRRHMQIVFQDPFGSLSPRMTVEQIVSEGLQVQSELTPTERLELTVDILKEVGLDPSMLHRYPHEFSGGQRQRIAIARTMVLRPQLVVLDEPTSALDRTVQAQIIDLLLKLQKVHNLAYLFISHDLRVVRALAHKILVMYNGDIVESGTTAEVFDNPHSDYTKSLMAAAFELRAEGQFSI